MAPMLSFTALKLLNVPEVTDCVRVDRDLHVKLFYMGSPLPLPKWFHLGRDCRLTRKSMMQNPPNYIKLEEEQTFNILKELKKLKFKKKEHYRPMLFDIHFFYVIILYKYTDHYERVSISILISAEKYHRGTT